MPPEPPQLVIVVRDETYAPEGSAEDEAELDAMVDALADALGLELTE